MTYKLLDLFCCQGGAAKGYKNIGFDVTGVDIFDQPRYPYNFINDDAINYLINHHQEYDCFHASPPCQTFSCTKNLHSKTHKNLIPEVREVLLKIGKPYVIENVIHAPLINPILLCGTMFKLKVFRHRKFESNFYIQQPKHYKHLGKTKNSITGITTDGEYISVAGHIFIVDDAKKAMGIDWMTAKGLSQALPPLYAEYVGFYMMMELEK